MASGMKVGIVDRLLPRILLMLLLLLVMLDRRCEVLLISFIIPDEVVLVAEIAEISGATKNQVSRGTSKALRTFGRSILVMTLRIESVVLRVGV